MSDIIMSTMSPPIKEQTSDDKDEELLELRIPPPVTDESDDVRRMAPDTTHYDFNGTKCSFDYLASCETLGFKTQKELKNIKCKEGVYNTRNEYIKTMKYCLDLETTENNKMLHESSKHFSCMDFVLDPPNFTTGMLKFEGMLPKFVHHNQKIELTLLEKYESTDSWIETDVYCKAVLLNMTDTAVNGLIFCLSNLHRFTKPKDNMQTWYGGREETEIEPNNDDDDDDADYDKL
uniref:Uncharacterized protein n=1 Tax=Romanomermis culicivorax TaxID=13658 RepID=A0A915IM75_ROMCU